MGIYDRSYMREEPDGASAGGGAGAWMLDHFNHLFIAANVVVWFLANAAQRPGQFNPIVENLQLSLDNLQQFRVWTVLSYALLELSAWSMIIHMLMVYYFGSEISALYGRANLIWFYFLAMLLPGGAFLLSMWLGQQSPLLPYGGGQGLAMAVLVLVTLWYPRRMMMIFYVIPCPLFLLTPVYILLMLTSFNQYSGARVYFAPPLCGAAFGLLFYLLDLRLFRGKVLRMRFGVVDWFRGWFKGGKKTPAGLQKMQQREDTYEPTERGGGGGGGYTQVRTGDRRPGEGAGAGVDDDWDAPPRQVSEADAQRVDALLDKIARKGKESLTDEELAFLQASSKKYRS